MLQTHLFWNILLAIMPIVLSRAEWIDPFSLEVDPRIMCNCDSTNVQIPATASSAMASYYTRMINLILNSLDYNQQVHSANFEVSLEQEDYNFMQSFLQSSLSDFNGKDWDRMDKLLTKMFINKGNTYTRQISNWYHYVQNNIKEIGVTLGTIVIIWFIYKLRHIKFQFSLFLKCFIFVLFIVDYMYTWIYMLKEKEVEQFLHAAYVVPPECNVKNMNYFAYFKYLVDSFKGKDSCAEYHKIKDIDIFWYISPAQILGMQFGNMILTPAEKIGNAFSKLISGVIAQSSWYSLVPTILVMPILLFGLILGACVLLSFLTGRNFSFNLLHLIQFSFGGGSVCSKSANDEAAQKSAQPQLEFSGAFDRQRKRMRLKGKKKTSMPEVNNGKHIAAIEGEREAVEDLQQADDHSGQIQTSSKLSPEADVEVIT